MIKTTCVVPTIRENSIKKFLEQWGEYFKRNKSRVIVVEDNPQKTFKISGVEHYAWDDIEKDLGKNSWIIPRRTSGVRDYGFLKAIERPTDVIYTADDDCMLLSAPEHDDFLLTHYNNLYSPQKINRWVSTEVSGKHVRGIPYKNTESEVNCVISHGYWDGVPDLDAIHQLAMGKEEKYEPFVGVIPRDRYFSLCSMNFAFKPEATSLVYQILNGQNPEGVKYPFERVDDIWAGVLAKKVCDYLGLYIHTGSPLIWHDRASNPFTNLQKESLSLSANEVFWEYIDKIKLNGECIESCYLEIAEHLQTEPLEGFDYWRKLGCAMERWVREVSVRRNKSG